MSARAALGLVFSLAMVGCKPATPCNESALEDADGDGFQVCTDGSGVTPTADDCDDDDANVNPAADEICTDGFDNDCDGATDGGDLINCGTDDTDDTGDTGDTDTDVSDPLLILTFEHTCAADSGDVFGSMWTYEITVSGANSGGLVLVDQDTTDPFHEEHDLTGAGTTLDVALVGAHADPPDQTANVSTLYQCGMESLMVWRYEVYAPDGVTLTDCVVASGAETDPGSVYDLDTDGTGNFEGCANGNLW